MKIKRLSIKSFRGIGDLTLEFDPDEPTVFIGINGVGKSSILDCLTILLSRFFKLIQFQSHYLTQIKQSKEKNTLDRQTSASEKDIKNGQNQTQNEITILLDGAPELNWAFTTNLSGQRNHISEELEAVVRDIKSQLKDNPETNIPLAVYYPVNRAILDIPLEIREEYSFKQVDAYERALVGVQISFDSFFQWFRAVEDLENEQLKDDRDYRDKRLEAVRQAIYSLMPDFSNLRVRRSPLRMTVLKQGQEFIINQLSDGEKCLLAMVGDLARRLAIANPSLANPLEGSGVVLIDEIELHLHPAWQRKIIPYFTTTFPNCQFIVTTHSPQVVSHVKPEGVYCLQETPKGIVALRAGSSYGRDSNRILEDLMDVPKRPQEIKEGILELFRLIDKKDLNGARQLRQKIADEIGEDESELLKADASIYRREILGR